MKCKTWLALLAVPFMTIAFTIPAQASMVRGQWWSSLYRCGSGQGIQVQYENFIIGTQNGVRILAFNFRSQGKGRILSWSATEKQGWFDNEYRTYGQSYSGTFYNITPSVRDRGHINEQTSFVTVTLRNAGGTCTKNIEIGQDS